jgi:hypothetical protein
MPGVTEANHRNLGHDRWCLGWDLNLEPSEYEPGLLLTAIWHLKASRLSNLNILQDLVCVTAFGMIVASEFMCHWCRIKLVLEGYSKFVNIGYLCFLGDWCIVLCVYMCYILSVSVVVWSEWTHLCCFIVSWILDELAPLSRSLLRLFIPMIAIYLAVLISKKTVK